VARLLSPTTATVVAFGHVHTPYVRTLAGRLLVDVASVGYPCDGDRRAAYATLEWDGHWRATIHRVPYDLDAVAAAFLASGIPRPKKRIKEMYRATE
jgi:diadenosine tetraphosphatase ApaH/serine/threonine PP2A family protein phosphatase